MVLDQPAYGYQAIPIKRPILPVKLVSGADVASP